MYNDEKESITFYLPRSLKEEIKVVASNKCLTASSLIRNTLMDYLEQEKDKRRKK